MNTYFKAVPKVLFRVLVEQHAMSKRYNILKTMSRLMGVFAGIIAALFCLAYGFHTIFAVPVIVVTILVMDIIFLAFGLKESSYKNKKFFTKNNCTPESLDEYSYWLTIGKFAIIVPVFISPTALIFCAVISLFLSTWAAMKTSYKPFIFDSGQGLSVAPISTNIHQQDYTANTRIPYEGTEYIYPEIQPVFEMESYTHEDSTHGIPGYDIAGVFTGSDTAIGGVSN